MPTPRYQVEALRFKCIDESGIDIFGSDEPMWFFSWTDGTALKTVGSREFGDIDSGDSRSWSPPLRITPAVGVPGPLAVSVQLYEIDQGDPDKMRTAVETAVSAASLASMVNGGPSVPLPAPVRDQLIGLLGNDLLGSHTVTFSKADLARTLRRPGVSMRKTLKLGGHDGDLPFSVAGGPDYEITLRVRRVQDAA